MLLEAKGVAQLHPNEWGKMGVEWECGGFGGGKVLKGKVVDFAQEVGVADVTAFDRGFRGEFWWWEKSRFLTAALRLFGMTGAFFGDMLSWSSFGFVIPNVRAASMRNLLWKWQWPKRRSITFTSWPARAE
jgi:hypothetical protein